MRHGLNIHIYICTKAATPRFSSLAPHHYAIPMATIDSGPPSYIEQPTTNNVDEGELPEYSRIAAADERIVDAQPQARAPRSSTTLPVEYVFRSERLELNMGPKKYPVKVSHQLPRKSAP
jgi:hypothetical protein